MTKNGTGQTDAVSERTLEILREVTGEREVLELVLPAIVV